ncbi:MAG: hypothetical protein NVS1B10_05100 [Candidatus Saccharimonadales bacterium]
MITKLRIANSLSSLRKVCFDRSSLTLISRSGIPSTPRKELGIIFYALSIGAALLLFNNYGTLFTSQKLLSSNSNLLMKVLLEPVLYLAACIYFLTLGLAYLRTIIPVLLIALLFFVGNKLSLNSFLSFLLILTAFASYYFQFYKNYSEYKRPTIAKTLNASLTVFIIFISLAISLNYYNGFSERINQLSDRLSTNVSRHFSFIENNYSSGTSKLVSHETLKQHVVRILKSSNTPVTETTITDKEKELIKGLGLPSARSNENYISLLDRATKQQIDLTIKNYRKILAIIVPFAFFFVTDVLANVSSNIAWLSLLITERLYTRKFKA